MERTTQIAIVAVFAILVVLFVPLIPVQETYTIEEPYVEEEPYERAVQYVVDDWNVHEKLRLLDWYVETTVVVRNIDQYGGTFTVIHRLYDINGLFGSVEDRFYLSSGDSYTSIATFDTRWGQDTRGEYGVNAPTVIDTRLVDKIRYVEKTRTVYKSLLQMFGFLENLYYTQPS